MNRFSHQILAAHTLPLEVFYFSSICVFFPFFFSFDEGIFAYTFSYITYLQITKSAQFENFTSSPTSAVIVQAPTTGDSESGNSPEKTPVFNVVVFHCLMRFFPESFCRPECNGMKWCAYLVALR